jgi:hypothetical protein
MLSALISIIMNFSMEMLPFLVCVMRLGRMHLSYLPVTVMDTRRYRSDVFTEDYETRTMLGDVQLAALTSWLHKVVQNPFPFFISN